MIISFLPFRITQRSNRHARRGAPVDQSRILAIGDGVKTDIRGAAIAGIESAFIASAIHVTGELDELALQQVFAGIGDRPVAALPALVW